MNNYKKPLLDRIENGGIGDSAEITSKYINAIMYVVKELDDKPVVKKICTNYKYSLYTVFFPHKNFKSPNIKDLRNKINESLYENGYEGMPVRVYWADIPNGKLNIEIANTHTLNYKFRQVLQSKLLISLGVDSYGKTFRYDLALMPHLLVGGATGSGKSQLMHNILFSIFFNTTSEEVKFILIDPKRVEFHSYNDVPYLLKPVITDIDEGSEVFQWLYEEQEKRIELLSENKVRNINDYNEKIGKIELPYIVVLVDEFSDLICNKPEMVEKNIVRLAQLSKATGIHLVLATSRPSGDVYTGLIKANIPSRMAFNTTSSEDSKRILDQEGAEILLGNGDGLFVPPTDIKPIRVQMPFISDDEINRMCDYLKKLQDDNI